MYPAIKNRDERWESFVSELVAQCGIIDERVEQGILDAFAATPRKLFADTVQVPAWTEDYRDEPVAIGANQFLTKPSILIRMISLLAPKKGARILEVGCGSGYASAIMSRFGAQVFGVENIASLAQSARRRLDNVGFQNVIVHHSDGFEGWREHAPYDGILVSVPVTAIPQSLVSQLAEGGRIVAPVETLTGASLMFLERTAKGFTSYMLEAIEFA